MQSTLSSSQIGYQMTLLEDVLKDIIGKAPVYMRPPFGSHSGIVDSTLESLGYAIVMWTMDSGDSQGLSLSQQQARSERELPILSFGQSTLPIVQATFTSAVNGGDEYIYLMHDVQPMTPQQLVSFVINWYKSSGLRAVTVGECMGYPNPSSWYRDFVSPINTAGMSCPALPY